MNSLHSFLHFFYYFGSPVVILAGLILSIVIICTKDKLTKLLGIWMTASSTGALLNAIYVLLLRYFGSDVIIRLSMFNNIVSVFFMTVCAVMIVIYANKKYGFKLYLGIILIAGNSVAGVLLRLVFNNILKPSDYVSAIQYNNLLSLIAAVPNLAVSIIWFIVFFKNRHKEKELNLLWLITLHNLVQIMFSMILNLYSFIFAAKDADLAQYSQLTVQLGAFAVSVVITLLFDIYVLVKGRKASEDNKLIIVDE